MARASKDTNGDSVAGEWDGTCGSACTNVAFSPLTLIGCPYCPGAADQVTTDIPVS